MKIPELEFLVNGTGEEYFIIKRMLCPVCRGRIDLVMQALEEGFLSERDRKKIGASDMTDWMLVECKDCGFEFSMRFHKSSGYREAMKGPFEEMREAISNEKEFKIE